MLKTFSFVEILEEEPHYDQEFVDRILKASSDKERIEVDPDNIWESINSVDPGRPLKICG